MMHFANIANLARDIKTWMILAVIYGSTASGSMTTLFLTYVNNSVVFV